MDSNRQYLDPDLLWDNLRIVPAGNVVELIRKVEENDLRDFDIVIIHVGVNDLDKQDGKTVAKRLISVTSRIKASAPGTHIILSEVTPRQLSRDTEVISCNKELYETLDTAENITIARHSNLRDSEWSFHKENDDKHITKMAIPKLAGNLKAAFRKAIGADRRMPSNRYEHYGGRNRRDNGGKNISKHFLVKELLRILK